MKAIRCESNGFLLLNYKLKSEKVIISSIGISLLIIKLRFKDIGSLK